MILLKTDEEQKKILEEINKMTKNLECIDENSEKNYYQKQLGILQANTDYKTSLEETEKSFEILKDSIDVAKVHLNIAKKKSQLL